MRRMPYRRTDHAGMPQPQGTGARHRRVAILPGLALTIPLLATACGAGPAPPPNPDAVPPPSNLMAPQAASPMPPPAPGGRSPR